MNDVENSYKEELDEKIEMINDLRDMERHYKEK